MPVGMMKTNDDVKDVKTYHSNDAKCKRPLDLTQQKNYMLV